MICIYTCIYICKNMNLSCVSAYTYTLFMTTCTYLLMFQWLEGPLHLAWMPIMCHILTGFLTRWSVQFIPNMFVKRWRGGDIFRHRDALWVKKDYSIFLDVHLPNLGLVCYNPIPGLNALLVSQNLFCR